MAVSQPASDSFAQSLNYHVVGKASFLEVITLTLNYVAISCSLRLASEHYNNRLQLLYLRIQVSKILPLEPNLQHFDYLRFQIKAAIGRKEQISPTMWSEYNKVSNVIKQKLIQIVASCTNSHSSWLQEFKAKYQHHPQNKDYPLVLKTVCHHKHVAQKLLLREWKLELH